MTLSSSLRMVICIPSGITEVEKNAKRATYRDCGKVPKKFHLIHEPAGRRSRYWYWCGFHGQYDYWYRRWWHSPETSQLRPFRMTSLSALRVITSTSDINIQYIRQHNINVIMTVNAEKVKIEVGRIAWTGVNPPAGLSAALGLIWWPVCQTNWRFPIRNWCIVWDKSISRQKKRYL